MSVSVYVRRGVKGRTTAWFVLCADDDHGLQDKPWRSKLAAERAAVNHGREKHDGNVKIHVPR